MFSAITVGSDTWTFDHLEPFSFQYQITVGERDIDLFIDVVFSCHCFSRDLQPNEVAPEEWLYVDERETRLLDAQRYALSKSLLRSVLSDMDKRKILFAGPENFMTIEQTLADGAQGFYQVFFVLLRKNGTKNRIEMKVQSAYFVDELHRRARPLSARKVRFKVLVTAAYEGRRLHAGR